ncbi:MAG: Ig-like domain repeat protein [Methanobrevibacter sp.]|nr:Ig-like domain repeat protein [Methanobrevibacter sp.]
MKFNKVMVACIFLLAILTFGAASAADENITDNTDDVLSAEYVSEDLSVDSADENAVEKTAGDLSELRSLADNASENTLNLDNDYENDESLESDIEINKTLTIDEKDDSLVADKKTAIKSVTFDKTAYYYGDRPTIKVYVDSAAKGNVQVTLNGVTKKLQISKSYLEFYFSDLLNAGTYKLQVRYAGSADYETQDLNYDLVINKQSPFNSYSSHPLRVSPWGEFSSGKQLEYKNQSSQLSIIRSYYLLSGYWDVTVDGVNQKIKIDTYYTSTGVPLDVLNLGAHEIKVHFAGNENFKTQTKTLSFTVVSGNPIGLLELTPGYIHTSGRQIKYTGEKDTLRVYMISTKISGNIEITVDGVTQKIDLSSVSYNYDSYWADYGYGYYFNVPLGVFNIGSHNVEAKYPGNEFFKAQNKSISFKVVKANPINEIYVSQPYVGSDSNNKNVKYTGQNSTFWISKAGNVPGNFHVTINGVTKKVKASSNYITLGVLTAGSYDIKVSYSGSAGFNAQNVSLSFKIVKQNPIESIYIVPGYVSDSKKVQNFEYTGKESTLKIYKVYANVPGNFAVTFNGVTKKVKIDDSYSLEISLGVLNLGLNEITVSYAGSAGFNAQTKSIFLNVSKRMPISGAGILSSTDYYTSSSYYGDDATIRVHMVDTNINGNIWFTISDENKTKLITDKIHIENGVATRNISNLGLGKYYLHIYYAGNVHYSNQTLKRTFEVIKKTPISSVEVINKCIGENTTINVKVNNVNGNIWFTLSDENHTAIITDKIHIENGSAIRSIPGLDFGKYNLHIYYAGNVHYKAQTIKDFFYIVKRTPINSVVINNHGIAENVTVNVNMYDDTVNGFVRFILSDKSNPNINTERVKIVDGVATYTVPNLQNLTLYRTYYVNVHYAGNTNYNAQTKETSFYLGKSYPTLSTFKTTENGKTVLTAKISKNATGNIIFTINKVKYTAKIVDGEATYTLPDLAAGTYTLTTSYAGDEYYYSWSATRSITIK